MFKVRKKNTPPGSALVQTQLECSLHSGCQVLKNTEKNWSMSRVSQKEKGCGNHATHGITGETRIVFNWEKRTAWAGEPSANSWRIVLRKRQQTYFHDSQGQTSTQKNNITKHSLTIQTIPTWNRPFCVTVTSLALEKFKVWACQGCYDWASQHEVEDWSQCQTLQILKFWAWELRNETEIT